MLGGIPYASQCVKVPLGASMSIISIAHSRVRDGGVLHSRRGRRFAPSQVNSRGTVPPERSGLETLSRAESCWSGSFTVEPPYVVSGSVQESGHAGLGTLFTDNL